MNPRSPAEFFKLLSNPRSILGQPESTWLDFKGDVYLPPEARPAHRWELAKDVTSMANAGGGLIVLGVATTLDEGRRIEVASDLRPIPLGLVDPPTMQKVIHEWVFPRLDVLISSHVIPGEEGELWAIEIQQQKDRDLPFIIAGALNADERRQHTAFGIYKRAGTDNAPVQPAQAQQWIRAGFNAFLQLPSTDTPPQAKEDADTVLKDDLKALGPSESRAYFFIQLAPSAPIRLESFFSGEEPSLWSAMYRLDQSQPSGFNLPSGVIPQRGWRNSHRTVIAGKSTLSVLPNGLTTVTTGEAMLTWASRQVARPGETLLNPHVFPELSFEACCFFTKHVIPRVPQQTPFMWRIGLCGVEGPPAMLLPPGPFQSLLFRDRPGSEPKRGEDFQLDWQKVSAVDPGELSFEMCRRVYEIFHLASDRILYAKDGRVSAEMIRKQEY